MGVGRGGGWGRCCNHPPGQENHTQKYINTVLIMVLIRHFLGNKITPKIGDSPRKPILAFSAQFLRLSALLFLFLSCISMKHKNYKKIFMNIIDDVIKTRVLTFFFRLC